MPNAATWLPDPAEGSTPLDRVLGLRPDLHGPFLDFCALFWQRRLVDPVLLELCRLRVAQLLGCDSELAVRSQPAVAAGLTEDQVDHLAEWPTAEGFADAERAALAFAEQFVIDPHGVDEAMRAELRGHLSEAEVVALTEALAIFDGFTRFRVLLCDDRPGKRVVAPPPGPATPLVPPDDADPAISSSVLGLQPETLTAFLRLYGTLWSHGEVPQPLKEVARIRNARITDCGY